MPSLKKIRSHSEPPSYDMTYNLTVTPPGGKYGETRFSVDHKFDGQHTLMWPYVEFPSVDGGPAFVFEAASCNLFTYPKVLRKGLSAIDAMPIEGLGGEVLSEILFGLAVEYPDFMHSTDASGAQPTLAIMVANTDQAVELIKDIFYAKPEYIQLCHADDSPFHGENALHVLAVNRREVDLCYILDLCADHLNRKQLEAVFLGQAKGAFFSEKPMSLYGGTVLSYCVAFSLHRAIACMMLLTLSEDTMGGLVDPNDQKIGCIRTGFLPLHVAVANSLTRMYDFMIELPNFPQLRHLRAERSPLSLPTDWGPGGELTPLQLATYLGDRRMFQHIMRRRSTILWVWGPVTMYQVNLDGIDSIGASDNDVMNLVARPDAIPETRSLLDDDMMRGFIFHELFRQKWDNFGRWFYKFNLFIDFLTIIAMLVVAVAAKQMPAYDNMGNDFRYHLVRDVGPIVVLVCMVPSLLQDVYLAFRYFQSVSASNAHFTSLKQDIILLWEWMRMHRIPTRWVAMTSSAAANIFMLITEPATLDSGAVQNTHDWLGPAWPFLAMPLLALIQIFAQNLLTPSETLGKYYIFIWRIFDVAVTPFIIIFLIYLINYGVALYLTAPRHVMDRVNPSTGVWELGAMIEDVLLLGLIGSELPLDFAGEHYDGNIVSKTDAWSGINLSIFAGVYLYYVLMSTILLLNLLIAQMGDCYNKAYLESTIDYRVNFARRVLLYEELAQLPFCRARHDKTRNSSVPSFCGLFEMHAGIPVTNDQGGTDYIVQFRSVTANDEGGGMGGVRPTFEEVDEKALDPLPPELTPRSIPKLRRPTLPRISANKAVRLQNDGPDEAQTDPAMKQMKAASMPNIKKLPLRVPNPLPRPRLPAPPLLSKPPDLPPGLQPATTPSAPLSMAQRMELQRSGTAAALVLPTGVSASAVRVARRADTANNEALDQAMAMSGLLAEPSDATFIDGDDAVVNDEDDHEYVATRRRGSV